MAAPERLAAIRKALSHPQFYDGDIGSDLRWCVRELALRLPEIDWERLFRMTAEVAANNLARAEKAEADLIGANEMKAKFEQSAADGWAKYRELKAGCLCACEDSLVREWMQKVREVARARGVL